MKFLDSPFYRYIQPEIEALRREGIDPPAHFRETSGFLQGLPENIGTHAYAPGKWTVSQLVGHMADSQLVFLGRILFIARGETSPLPGFDENLWVETSGHREKGLAELAGLYAKTAGVTETVLASLPKAAFSKVGTANGVEISAEEVLLYMLAHDKHHAGMLRTRYLR